MSGMSNNIKEIVEDKNLCKKDIITIEDPIELNNILSEIIVKMGDLIHNGITQEFSIINEETLVKLGIKARNLCIKQDFTLQELLDFLKDK